MVLWILATVAAFFVKGVCGFANTLVFTSILAFGITNVSISPVELLLGYPSNIILTWKNRARLRPGIWILLSLLVLAGSFVGTLLLKNVNPGYIKIIFGVVVILLGIEMLLRESGSVRFKESKVLLSVIGIISGVLCGLFGVGALLAAYVGRTTESSDEFKANICAIFILENTFRIILYIVLGIITLSAVKHAVILLPFMAAGLYTGIRCGKVLHEKTVKRLVIAFLILSGIIMIITNI